MLWLLQRHGVMTIKQPKIKGEKDEIKTLVCKNEGEPLFLVGDLNINTLDHSINTKLVTSSI